MLMGRAVGGPRDGVRLTADRMWDGRIRMPSRAGQGEHRDVNWHDGHYVWHDTWVWEAGYQIGGMNHSFKYARTR